MLSAEIPSPSIIEQQNPTSISDSSTRKELSENLNSVDGSGVKLPSGLVTHPSDLPIPEEQVEVWDFTKETLDLFGVEYPITPLGATEQTIIRADHLVYRFIPLPDIVADVTSRGVISDFSTLKMKRIMDSKLDELLIAHNYSTTEKHFFFVYLHSDAVMQFCNGFGLAPHVQKSALGARVQGWVSLGSDKEIQEEKATDLMKSSRLLVIKPRKEFGRPYQFHDRDSSDTYVEFKSTKIEGNDLVRKQKNFGVQAAPFSQDNITQTSANRLVNYSTQYEPYGFSKEEAALILERPDLVRLVLNSTPRFHHYIKRNNFTNIFSNNITSLGEDDVGIEQGAQISLLEFQSFTDLKHSKDRSISCIDWHPTQKGLVAVSCTQRCTLDEKIDMGYHAKSKNSVLLLWNFNDPIHPQLILEGPDEIQIFRFHPTNPSIVIGGCNNGQIIVWDISDYYHKLRQNKRRSSDKEKQEVAIVHHISTSSIDFSHRGPVMDIVWVPSSVEIQNHGEICDAPENSDYNQFVTCSLDGQVFFWDLRFRKELKLLDLVWRPFIKVPLSSMDNTFDYGCTRLGLTFRSPSLLNTKGSAPGHLDYSITDKAQLTKFFCGTEEGDLIFSDWIDKKTEEKVSRVEQAWNNHLGMITDLQRSPFFNDILLSVGSYCFHIWKEQIMNVPLLSSHVYSAYLTGGRWSNTRPGVFFIAKSNGSIEAWDLMDRSHEPSLIQNISAFGLTGLTLKMYPGHTTSFIACGDDNGTLHILQIPKVLSKQSKNERSIVKAFFDREIKRVLFNEERRIMTAAKGKEEISASANTETVKKDPLKQESSPENNDELLNEQFKNLEKDFIDRLAALG